MKTNAMFRTLFPTLAAAMLAGATLLPAAPAHAGDLSNATLGCYIDTSAWDVTTPYYCETGWTPYNGAGIPGSAFFEVSGLPAGNYSFTWTNLNTGLGGQCGGTTCGLSIGLHQSVTFSVLIRDNDTGATTTVVAQAYYYDGWS